MRYMNTAEQVEYNGLVAKCQQLRTTLDEIKAEGARLRAENEKRWDRQKAALAAMQAAPGEATAREYLASCEESDIYERRHACDERRRKCLDDLHESGKKILALIGCGWTSGDREAV